MKNKQSINLLIGVAYISYFVGGAAFLVGTPRPMNEAGEVYEAWLPLLMFILLAVPFFVGFMAGRDSKD